LPRNCDLTKYEPEVTPAKKCEYHYTRSQEIIETAFRALKTADELEMMIQCVRDKMKIVEPNKDAVCFYTGFRPNNIVSI